VSTAVPTAEEFAALVARVAELEARLAATTTPEYLDTRQAATYLGCTPGRISKLKQRGRLPFIQEAPGCRIHYARNDLNALMTLNRNEPQT
jgi:hypothetical protein